MAAAGAKKLSPTPLTSPPSTYDRLQELKAFDDTQAGVKGLVDAGVTKIPRIFVRPPPEHPSGVESASPSRNGEFSVPVIDLKGSTAVDEIRRASGTSGFFQIANHGIPVGVLEGMLRGARAFHEQPLEAKRRYYTRDKDKKVRFNSNFDLYESRFANWRDTFGCIMGPAPLDPLLLPDVCRDIILEYTEGVKKVGEALLGLLSEALGLKTRHLIDMDCGEGQILLGNYYPGCPEPDLTMGTSEHSDPSFLTVLLQDQCGGLQFHHQNKWVDVPPVPGTLVVNIGDLMQLISNGKFQSAEHRVLARQEGEGPRVSVAYFFGRDFRTSTGVVGPIQELLSEDEPPLYRETTVEYFVAHYNSRGLDGKRSIAHFKL